MEGESDQAETMSKRPLEQFLVEVVNSLSRRFLGATGAITFTLRAEGTTAQQAERAAANKDELFSGQKTLNAIQADLGQPLYEMPEADEPFIVAGSQVIFLKGLLDVDSAGDTIGQTAAGTAAAEASGHATTGGSEPTKPSTSEPEPVLSPEQATEIKAYRAFVSKRRRGGTWRDFEFTAFDDEQAARLNAAGAESVKAATTIKASRRPLDDRPTMYRAHNI
jgi:hypothetical protein